MKKILFVCVLLSGLAWSQKSVAQTDYPTLNQATQRLQKIGSNPVVELKSLTKTAGGKDIWALKIGTGNLDQKPAIAVVGGIEGYHVLSTELAIQFAEKLLQNHMEVLEKTTFFIFPNMSPDAYEQYHAALKYERRGNSVAVDHDRDGIPGDNGYTDLNGDGLISLMRVESVMGEYKRSKEDERVLERADRSKGEAGQYLLFHESKDSDQDGKFAEDLQEGIAFNKSLTYKFPVFQPLAGDIPVSQLESRALLDYLFEQWNIFAFVSFSPANNLSTPLKFNAADAKKRVVTSILEKDQTINAMVSEMYNETITAKPYQQTNQGTDGDFFQWAYFHFARLSFSTPGYWIPEYKDAKGKSKTNPEANYLAWADSLGWTDSFVPWKEIQHPDFPDQKVEIGGIKPFKTTNPPFEKVAEIAQQHTDFILKIATIQPKLELLNLKSEAMGNGLTRITVDLYNNAALPTHSEMGARSRWLRKIRVDLDTAPEKIISGDKIKLINSLGSFEKTTLSWIVRGTGIVTIKVGASHTGFTSVTVNL